MNRKGFTLIELIVTIALLAVVSIISFVSITGIINDSKEKDCNNLVKSIKSATKDYISDNRYNDDFLSLFKRITDDTYYMSANILTDENYLSSPITNPFDTKSEIEPSSITIEITLNKDYTVKNISISNPDVLENCQSE